MCQTPERLCLAFLGRKDEITEDISLQNSSWNLEWGSLELPDSPTPALREERLCGKERFMLTINILAATTNLSTCQMWDAEKWQPRALPGCVVYFFPLNYRHREAHIPQILMAGSHDAQQVCSPWVLQSQAGSGTDIIFSKSTCVGLGWKKSHSFGIQRVMRKELESDLGRKARKTVGECCCEPSRS